MEKGREKGRRGFVFLAVFTSFFLMMALVWIFFSNPIQSWWKTFTRESMRILGREQASVSPEEKRIREEVILKKMEEASRHWDWRHLAPEYPRPNRMENVPEKDRIQVLRETPEFKEMDRDLKDYLVKKEDQLLEFEPPTPPLNDPVNFTILKDKAAEEVARRLVTTKEKAPVDGPLEENLRLGIKGPVASRKIIERPPLAPVRVRVETEIELTFWVLPNGTVDRAIPSVKGDSELERIAIQYVKQWRFVALPKDQSQVEQWGTIPIKFRFE